MNMEKGFIKKDKIIIAIDEKTPEVYNRIDKDTIKYYKNVNEITFQTPCCNENVSIQPQDLLDVLDECLLLKIKQFKLHKITKMTEYIKRHEKLAEEARNASTRLELAKLNTEKLLLKEIRHAVKLMEMEENAIKTEMLERQIK